MIRARELMDNAALGSREDDVAGAIVLGQEMADERAQHIAKRISDRVRDGTCLRNPYDEAEVCAGIARDTIAKPEPNPYWTEPRFMAPPTAEAAMRATQGVGARTEGPPGPDEARIRADERENIRKRLDAEREREPHMFSGLTRAIWLCSPQAEVKTREAVLEEALRFYAAQKDVVYDSGEVARSALEWKPL